MAENSIRDISTDTQQVIMQAGFPQFTPEQLFSHWIQPDLLRQWWPPQAEIEAQSDGHYHLMWPSMNWHLRGTYSTFEPGKTLAFTWAWDHEPNRPARTVEVQLQPQGDGTRLTLTHGTYTDSPEDQNERQGHIEGWQHFLGQLQSIKPTL